MEESVSAFIVGTCRMLQKSYTDLYQYIRFQSIAAREMYEIRCGSTAEFYIQPLRSCIGDVDIFTVRPHLLALTDNNSDLTYAARAITDVADCFLMEPYNDYPAFVRLRRVAQIRLNWDSKILECIQIGDKQLLKTTDMSAEKAGCTHSPAVKHARSTLPPHDVVECMLCPQWPKEAKNWPNRQRKYGWPATDKIEEIIHNGCHVVFAKHPACRNDIHQCRLSFSVAEVILLQSWTQIQQIVYHMLRFFVKRELIEKDCPKDDEVLCTYHLKTLMLWSCEQMLPECWISTSVIEICCNLLQTVVKWLIQNRCPNYFIPDANLFHEHFNQKVVDETVKRLTYFC